MEKHIFIVNGRPRAGKDTFAEILGELSKVYKYSSVTKVKEIAAKCGWDGGKTEKDRKFLSDLKMLTTDYSDMPFEDISRHVKWFKNHGRLHNVMLIDIREPEEIERAAKAFGAKTIFIDNKNVKKVTSNSADANVENFEYDYVISNNGTLDDFRKEIEIFYKQITKGEK